MGKEREKITLKEAREQGKLNDFIKEHEKDAPGDADAVDEAIKNIASDTRPSPSMADIKKKINNK